MDYRNLTKNLGQLFFEWTQKYLENIALVQLNDKNELTTVTYRQLTGHGDLPPIEGGCGCALQLPAGKRHPERRPRRHDRLQMHVPPAFLLRLLDHRRHRRPNLRNARRQGDELHHQRLRPEGHHHGQGAQRKGHRQRQRPQDRLSGRHSRRWQPPRLRPAQRHGILAGRNRRPHLHQRFHRHAERRHALP